MDVIVRQPGGEPTPRTIGDAPLTIGRAGECGIVLDDESASRHHAVFEKVAGLVVVTDLGSSNGTWLNGTRLRAHVKVPLREGDVVEIGASCIAVADATVPGWTLPDERPGDATTVPPLHAAAGGRGERTRSLSRADLSRAAGARELEESLALVTEKLRVDSATIFLCDAATGLKLAAAHPDRAAASVHVGGVAVRCFEQKAPRTVAVAMGAQVRSILAVPLGLEGIPLGVLAVERRAGARLEPDAADALAALAARIVLDLPSVPGASREER